jgi:hypothetical protein
VILYWETVEEQNSDYYLIERSNDGYSYTTIATIKANAGNDKNTYTYQDKAPLIGKSLYRLRQVDRDGRSIFSPVRTVSLKMPDRLRTVQQHQNLTIYYGGEGKESFTLYNTQGHQVKQGTLVNHKCSISGLYPGLYIICLKTTTDIITTTVLITR